MLRPSLHGGLWELSLDKNTFCNWRCLRKILFEPIKKFILKLFRNSFTQMLHQCFWIELGIHRTTTFSLLLRLSFCLNQLRQRLRGNQTSRSWDFWLYQLSWIKYCLHKPRSTLTIYELLIESRTDAVAG